MSEKAWAFYRRSTDKQELSIEDQRAKCSEKAQARGLRVVHEFVPVKSFHSGLTIEKEPAFQEMVRLAELRNHGVRYLLIYSVSRLGRMPANRKIYWEERLRDCGIEIIYVAEMFSNDGSTGDNLTRYLAHDTAHQFSMQLSRDTIRGSKSHAALGHSCGGAAPIGFDRQLIDKNGNPLRVLAPGEHKSEKLERIVWTPGTQDKIELVRWMFRTRAKGHGPRYISDDLNRRKVPTARGNAWSKSAVRAILMNRAYIGERVFFVHNYHARGIGPHKKVRPPEEWVVAKDAHPAIVPVELFDQVQALFKTRKARDGRHYDSVYLLGGLIRCTRCGHRFCGQAKSHKGVKTPYYQCNGYHQKGKHVCESFEVPCAQLDSFAKEAVHRRTKALLREGAIEATLKGILADLERGAPEDGGASLGAELERLKREIENLVSAVRRSGGSPSLLAELERLEGQKSAVEAKLSQLDAPVKADALDITRIAKEAAALLGQGATGLRAEDITEAKAVMRTYIDRIEVDPKLQQARFYVWKVPGIAKKIAGPRGSGDSCPSDGCGGWI